jgi:hypothetical protein
MAAATLLAGWASWACNDNGDGDVIKEVPYATRDSEAEAEAHDDQRDESPPPPGLPVDPMAVDNSGFGFPNFVDDQASAWCPMLVDGVEVQYEELPGVAALAFRTTSGDVEDLQRRVEQLARRYELRDSERGSMVWQHHRHTRAAMAQQGQGGAVGAIPPSTAKVDNFVDGARLVLRPTEPDDLEILRERVRGHRARMKAGECWMDANGVQ